MVELYMVDIGGHMYIREVGYEVAGDLCVDVFQVG